MSLASLGCPQDEPPYHYQSRCHQHHRHFLLTKLKFVSSSSSDPDYDSKYSDSGYISSLPLPVYVAVQQPTPALPPGVFSVLTFPSPAHTLLLPVSIRQRTSQPCSHKPPNKTVYQSVSLTGLALAEFWKTLGSDHMMALETCQCSHWVGNCKLQGVGIWAFPFLLMSQNWKLVIVNSLRKILVLFRQALFLINGYWCLTLARRQPSFLSRQPHCPRLSSLCPQYISVLNSLPVAMNPKLHTRRCKKE